MVWWQCALWGVTGAAVNRALIFLEANRRAKGAAWRYPEGPGGGFFALAVLLHCGIAAAVGAAAAATISEPLLALGLGVVAPVAVKKIGQLALAALPPLDEGDAGDPVPDEVPSQGGGNAR